MKNASALLLAVTALIYSSATADVLIGTNSLSVLWPNVSLTQQTKDFVQADLSKIFSFAKGLPDAFEMPTVNGEGNLYQYPFPTPYAQALHITVKLSNSNNVFRIKLETPLLSAYEEAEALVNKNPIAVESFTNVVSAFNTGSVTNMHLSGKKAVFWIPANGEISDAQVIEYVNRISGSLFLHVPSVLNYETDVELADGAVATIAAFVPVTHRGTGLFATVYCLVWENGVAKLYVF